MDTRVVFQTHWIGVVCLGLFLSSALAEEKADRLTPMDVFNLQYTADPQISPDGKHIVYVRQYSDVMTDS